VLGGIVTAVTWVAQAFVGVGTAIGTAIGWIVVHAGKVIDWFATGWGKLTEVVKAPFTAAFEWIGGKIDAFMAKWEWLKGKLGMGADAPPLAWNTGGASGPAAPDGFYKPLKAGGGASVTNNHYPIQVTAAPGREVDAAKAVSAELDRRDRAKAAARRSRLGDTE
jgi:hypothetical protein